MPLYTWSCDECKKEIETIQPISQSDVPPEEVGTDSCPVHKWKKILKGAPQKAYGPGWNTRKGYH